MIIKSIELADYRNYDSLVLQFDRGTNILYGDNAQGKTNILEAIYVAATTKSHKGSKDREIVNFDKEEAHIRTDLEKLGLTGAEVSINQLPAGAGVPFVHAHRNNEEIYGIIAAYRNASGRFGISDKTVCHQSGTFAGRCQLCAVRT